MSHRSKYCVIGVPDHQGVLNVGGRIGAASGPRAFRQAFARLNGRLPVRTLGHDAGDVTGLGSDVSRNHRLASEFIRSAHEDSGITVVVGGGHDHGYSQLSAIAATLGKSGRLGCINIDAHLDLRKPDPLIGSGSPFYLAIESGVLESSRLVEFGVQAHCNAPGLWQYAARKKVAQVPFEKLRGGKVARLFKQELNKLSARCDVIVVSLDLDAAAQAYAPGVSAPQAEGFTASEILELSELAGRARKVVSFGIFELNPEHDLDRRTAVLGATAAWHFLEQALHFRRK